MSLPPAIRSIKLGSRFKKVLKLDENLEKLKLPEFDPDEAEIEGGKHTAEFWASSKKIVPAYFNAAKVTRHWPVGAELTEIEFDAAITATTNIKIR